MLRIIVLANELALEIYENVVEGLITDSDELHLRIRDKAWINIDKSNYQDVLAYWKQHKSSKRGWGIDYWLSHAHINLLDVARLTFKKMVEERIVELVDKPLNEWLDELYAMCESCKTRVKKGVLADGKCDICKEYAQLISKNDFLSKNGNETLFNIEYKVKDFQHLIPRLVKENDQMHFFRMMSERCEEYLPQLWLMIMDQIASTVEK